LPPFAGSSPDVNRLALGTVQFGLAYGVANQSGQISHEEGARILAASRAAGIDTLDTAIGYGESERVLGELGAAGWRVVSKLPAAPAEDDVDEWVERSVAESLRRLRVDRLAGLLLHRPDQLNGPGGPRLFAALQRLKARGVVEKIGVSIYDPNELAAWWPRLEIDLVQAPFNVIDRRLVTSGWLEKLKDGGVEVHTRSAFLQGLLLMQRDRRPAWFDRWEPLLNRWDAWLVSSKRTALQASLGFALNTPGIDRVVVGVDSARQLKEILEVQNTNSAGVPDEIQSDDPDLVNPARWRIA
jgi:aryl-alcohol dehydrogenase-like predicted oxidoreductase